MHTVVELASYLRKAESLLSDQERADVVWMLACDPECGDVITGTGGFRKVRIPLQGRGKSGGARVIYFLHNKSMPVYIMAIYAKNEKSSLSQAEKNALRKRSDEITKERKL